MVHTMHSQFPSPCGHPNIKQSFSINLYLSSWKISDVPPLFKCVNNKQSLINYRPILFTSQSCIMLEHIILKHNMLVLESNELLPHRQRGFRRSFSTISQLAEFTHDISLSIDHGEQADTIFIYFAKAFDTILHSLLIST